MVATTTFPHLAKDTPGPGIPYARWNDTEYQDHEPYTVVICPACEMALPDHPTYALHWEKMVERENKLAQEDDPIANWCAGCGEHGHSDEETH